MSLNKQFTACVLMAACQVAPAATFTVTTTNDSGAGSLRQAIIAANTNPGPDSIAFNLPPGNFIITPASPLPSITNVTLDGFTQNGSWSNTLANGNNANQLVQLQGSPASGTGLTLTGSSNVVRGIVFTGFAPNGMEVVSSDNVVEGCLFGITPSGITNRNDQGILVHGSRNRIGGTLPGQRVVISGNSGALHLNFSSASNVVQGCFVGTDIAGVGMKANAFDGILVNGMNNLIGGTPSGARNVFCGFGTSGIDVRGSGHIIQGNVIGTDATGTNVLGNFTTGINLPFDSPNNLIGGGAVGAGNVVLGASGAGSCIEVRGNGNVIQGNFIGTDASRTVAAGKPQGILVLFHSGTIIGGTNAGEGNVIAFNGQGVLIGNGAGNTIRGNSIHSNTGRGIALGSFLNINDLGDGDVGPNELQNYPTITNAVGTPAGTTIQGFFSSKASTLYELDFFSSVERDTVNRGEGQKYLGSISALTDEAGVASFSVMVPGVMLGRQISATATDPAGNTSEFSDCFAASSTFAPVTNVVVNTSDSGPGSLRQVLLNANTNASATPNVITFAIPGAGPHVIRLLSALPPPIEWVAIEGFTQPGASANTSTVSDNAIRKIVLDGSMAGAFVNGLAFETDSNVVRGLMIQNFHGHGMVLNTNSTGNVIEGCFITGNTNSGVLVHSGNNRIGGAATSARNVLSWNGGWGVSLLGPNANQNFISGNFVGSDSAGSTALPNAQGGILISGAPANTIGGSQAGRNIISGNGALFFAGPGIQISGATASNNLVQGNHIGATPTGAALGNKGDGVLISDGAGNTVVGEPVAAGLFTAASWAPPVTGQGNLIVNNGGAGIRDQGILTIFRKNSYGGNNGLATDIGFGGVTLNVNGGARNFPVITSALVDPDAGTISIQGNYNGPAFSTVVLDFHSTVRTDPTGYGEGNKFIGTISVTTDGSGNSSPFNHTFNGVQSYGEFLTAHASSVFGSSEAALSVRAHVVDPANPQELRVTEGQGNGPGTLPRIAHLADSIPGINTVKFDVQRVVLSQGIRFTGRVNLDGDLGEGQKAWITGEEMSSFDPLLRFTAGRDWVRNLGIAATSSDAVEFNGANNWAVSLDIGADIVPNASSSGPAISGAVQGNAIVFTGTPAPGENVNVVGPINMNNVRGNGINAGPGYKVDLAGPVVLQSIGSGLPFSVAGGLQAPIPVSYAPGPEPFTHTVNFRISVSALTAGEIMVYKNYGGPSGRWESVVRQEWTKAPGTSVDVPVLISDGNRPYSVGAQLIVDRHISPLGPLEPVNGTIATAPPLSHANNSQSAFTKEPVSLLTGEYFDMLPPDLHLGGPLPLAFQRYYGSFLLRDGRSVGRLGNNWRHNFEWSLSNKTTTVEIVSSKGRVITFTNNSGNFALLSRRDIPYQLGYVFGSGDFLLADPLSQTVYRFDPAGKLISTSDSHGNSHQLSYHGPLLTNVTDGLGRSLNFSYNPSGFLTNVSDGTRSVGFVQSNSNLVQTVDALGKSSANFYAAFPFPGLLTQRNRPLGNTRFTQTYDAAGRVSNQRQSGSTRSTRFAYGFNLCVQTDPDAFAREFHHNDNGEFTAFADEAALVSTMSYNGDGQRISTTDRRGLTTRIAYHAPSGQIAAVTNADGSVMQFTYTNRSFGGITFYDLSKVTFPDGTSESYAYDGSGNITSLTDPAGKVSRFSWNVRGQLLSATNPAGGVVTFTYNPDGTIATSKDSETGATSYFYDGLKRLTNVVHSDGSKRQWQFDANDRLLSITDERMNTTSFAYDANDRLIHVIDAQGQTAGFGYDDADRVIAITNSTGEIASIHYDPRGHLAEVLDFNGMLTAFSMDPRHRLAGVSQGGQSWEFGYNNESQLTSITNPLSQASAFTLDELGFTIGATNPLGQAEAFARDVMRRLTNSVDAIGRADRFGYDVRGLLASAAAPVIGTASFARNDLGLLARITGLNSEQWNFGYSSMGRLQFISDPFNRTNRITYNSRGRHNSTTFADGATVTNTFDFAGNLVRQQFSTGPDLAYAYDKVNRLTNAAEIALAYDSESRLTNTLSAGVNFGATSDAAGRLDSVSYNNGAFSVTYAYNAKDELVSVNDSLTGTSLQFVYDQAGRLINIFRPNGVNSTYVYDPAGRLTRVQEGTIIDVEYTLDAAGQIAMAGFNAPLDPAALITNTQSAPFTYDAAHQINSAGFNYDMLGRLISSPGKIFTWDGGSRLTGIGAVTFGYNGLGDLITRTDGGVTTRFFRNYAISLAPIMAERNENTMQTLRYYVWSPGGRLLYMIDAANGNTVRHYHLDRVGSTLALTSPAGTVTDAYAYTPYGELLGRSGTSDQPFTYIGAYGVRSEPAANLYHMRGRYYDPLTARFLSREPVWPVLDQPRGLDPYQYAYGEPMRFIDPTGLDAEEVSSGPANRVGFIRDYSVIRVGFIRDYSVIRVGYVHDYSQIVKQPRFVRRSTTVGDYDPAFRIAQRSYAWANALSGGFAEFLLRQQGDPPAATGLVPTPPARVGYISDLGVRIVQKPRENPNDYMPVARAALRSVAWADQLSGGMASFLLHLPPWHGSLPKANFEYVPPKPLWDNRVNYITPQIIGYQAGAAYEPGTAAHTHGLSAGSISKSFLEQVLDRNECPAAPEAGPTQLDSADDDAWSGITRAQRDFYP